MLRSFYAYTRVYIPFVLVFLVLLSGLFVYKQINPDLTLAQHWEKIQQKWEPPQTAALNAISDDATDFAKSVVDYGNLKTATEGWLNDVGAAKDWGPATVDVQTFITDTTGYVQRATQAASAASSTDIDNVSAALETDSQTFASDVVLVRIALGLKAIASQSPSLGASGASQSATPSGSASAGASGSATASGSSAASGSSSPSASASPTASSSASPTPSQT